MRTLVWTPAFVRAVRRVLRRRPELQARIEVALERLLDDPFQASLRTHKLKGELENVWAASVDYDYRLLFELATNSVSGEQEVRLLAIGTHDEVY